MAYQIVNGIPTHLHPTLEKVDFDKLREEREKDPRNYLEHVLGFSSKEVLLMEISSKWDKISKSAMGKATKEEILSI